MDNGDKTSPRNLENKGLGLMEYKVKKYPRVYQIFVHHLRGSTKLRNTPVIIKFVLHRLTKENRLSTYACINYGEAYAPEEIADRSIVINADAGEVIEALLRQA